MTGTGAATTGTISEGRGWSDHRLGPSSWREQGPARADDAPPLVFLHGLGGSRKAWGPQLEALSSRFRCIAWDMPGYGLSEPEQPLTYRAIVERLIRLLDDLELAEVDLVGLSFGGMHALHTALAAPDRIHRLVLADTSPAFGMDGTRPEDWIDARLAPLAGGASPADIGPRVLDAIVGRPLDPSVRADLVEAFADIPADGFRAAVRCLPDNDVRADLTRIRQRSMVIVGELDTETPAAYARVLADGLPDSTLVVMRGVGHLAPSEDPATFNALVTDFLEAP